MEAVNLMQAFIGATVHVLNAMVQLSPKSCEPFFKKDNIARGDISAFMTAEDAAGNKGSIALTFPMSTALAVVEIMFGNDLENPEESAKEMVGELGNIISGDARRRMAEQGVVFAGSTPTMLEGHEHCIQHVASAPVIAMPFELPEGRFMVEATFEG